MRLRRGDRRRRLRASGPWASRAPPGEAMGKRVIVAADGPGFLVNRCGRPFGLEALRLLGRSASRRVEQIDRICRLGGGFRMGPFELMDLVGVDVGFDVSRSFYELSLRRAALAAVPDHRAAGGRRAPRAQDRARLLRLPLAGRIGPRTRTRRPPAGGDGRSARGRRGGRARARAARGGGARGLPRGGASGARARRCRG